MERGTSFRLSRSHGAMLLSESVTSECARITAYERLSKSMRLTDEYDFSHEHRRRKRSLGILSKVFSFRRIYGHPSPKVAASAEKKKKKQSSWLPDPDKRWPIQGW